MIQEFNTAKAGPKTHVLLIGVGGYPFLKDGTNSVPQIGEVANLGQLTSPMPSVTAFYNKIIEYDTKAEWLKPLGSIEILVTPPPNSVAALPALNIENASLQNIRKSYFSWKARCDQHEDNVALFYYCGHGFQKSKHFLLADDFGEIPQNPWLNAFNFDDTRDAFYECKATTPVFLVDACRQVTVEMLEKDLTVAPIDNPSLINPEESLNHLTLKATAAGTSAYGKINEPTYFIQAVISGLDGLVARQENNDWLIETADMSVHIHRLLELIKPGQGFKQRCQPRNGMPAAILSRKNAPSAWLEISCDPDGALPLAGLSCVEDEENPTITFSRPPEAGTWKLNLKAGNYKLAADFQPGGNFKNSSKKTAVIPPIKKDKIICT